MARGQGAALDRKKLMADPIMVTTIVVLISLLTLFILYPLAILLVDSFVGDGSFGLSNFNRIFAMPSFVKAITNTLRVGFVVGIFSTLVGLLFAYVEVFQELHAAPSFNPLKMPVLFRQYRPVLKDIVRQRNDGERQARPDEHLLDHVPGGAVKVQHQRHDHALRQGRHHHPVFAGHI